MWHIDDIEEDNWDVNKDQNVFHQIKQFFGGIAWEKKNMSIIGNLIISNHKDLYKTACFYFLNIFLWFWLRQSAFPEIFFFFFARVHFLQCCMAWGLVQWKWGMQFSSLKCDKIMMLFQWESMKLYYEFPNLRIVPSEWKSTIVLVGWSHGGRG